MQLEQTSADGRRATTCHCDRPFDTGHSQLFDRLGRAPLPTVTTAICALNGVGVAFLRLSPGLTERRFGAHPVPGRGRPECHSALRTALRLGSSSAVRDRRFLVGQGR